MVTKKLITSTFCHTYILNETVIALSKWSHDRGACQ